MGLRRISDNCCKCDSYTIVYFPLNFYIKSRTIFMRIIKAITPIMLYIFLFYLLISWSFFPVETFDDISKDELHNLVSTYTCWNSNSECTDLTVNLSSNSNQKLKLFYCSKNIDLVQVVLNIGSASGLLLLSSIVYRYLDVVFELFETFIFLLETKLSANRLEREYPALKKYPKKLTINWIFYSVILATLCHFKGFFTRSCNPLEDYYIWFETFRLLSLLFFELDLFFAFIIISILNRIYVNRRNRTLEPGDGV